MVKEHFEINVCPIAVRLTYKLVVNLENFFFDKTPVVEETQEQIVVQPGLQGKQFIYVYDKISVYCSASTVVKLFRCFSHIADIRCIDQTFLIPFFRY